MDKPEDTKPTEETKTETKTVSFPQQPQQLVPQFDSHDIREVKRYIVPNGREVIELVQTYGKNPAPNIYKGIVVLQVRPVNQAGFPMAPQELPLEFPFPNDVTTPKRAFERFDEVAKIAVEAWKQEQAKLMEEARNRITKATGLTDAQGRPIDLLKK